MAAVSGNDAPLEQGAAERLVHALSRIPGVRAVILGGSRSRGYCDEHSDLDIGVLNDSGLAGEGYLRIVRDLVPRCDDHLVANASEIAFRDDDGQWVDLHCARLSEWQHALRICETDPRDAEPWHLEILQTCHFAVPLFDPDGEAAVLRRRAQTQSPLFWCSYGDRYLRECRRWVARFRRCEGLPPLAQVISGPLPLFDTFRALGAANHCFYFGGWQMEYCLGSFPLKPERVQGRLERVYGLTQPPVDFGERRLEYESLVGETSRLLWDACDPLGAYATPRREAEVSYPGEGDERQAEAEPLTVSPWIRTRDDILGLLARLSHRVHSPPSELSKCARRGALCFFQGMLRPLVGNLVEAVLALNAIQKAPLLELDKLIRGLPLQPQGTYTRIFEILHCANPADTLAPLADLIGDTEAIVRAQRPG